MGNIQQWLILIILSIFEVSLMLVLIRSFIKYDKIIKPNEEEEQEIKKLVKEDNGQMIWHKAHRSGEIFVWIQVINIFLLIACSLYLQNQIKIMF